MVQGSILDIINVIVAVVVIVVIIVKSIGLLIESMVLVLIVVWVWIADCWAMYQMQMLVLNSSILIWAGGTNVFEESLAGGIGVMAVVGGVVSMRVQLHI